MPSLEDLLVSTNLITPAQLAYAQHEAEQRRRPLAQTIIDIGIVNDRRFAEWMSDVAKAPLVDPLSPGMVHDVERYLARAVAREYEVVPIDVNADEMTVAMVNPLDRICLDVLHTTTGMKIRAVVALHGQLKPIIDRLYPAAEPASGAFDPSATVVAPPKGEPFQFGTETLLRSHNTPFAFDESIGSETRVLPPDLSEGPAAPAAPAPAETSAPSEVPDPDPQLDRIEHNLIELIRHVESLHRRIEAMDQTLARILTRR